MAKVYNLKLMLLIMVGYYIAMCSNSQFYNNRTKCAANQFIFSVQWANFMMNMQYSPAAYNQFYWLLPSVNKFYHYGPNVIQLPSEQANKQQNQCKNFFMHDNICCHYDQLGLLIATTIQGYKNSYYLAKFPIVDLIYKIYNQNSKYPNCSTFSAFHLPGVDNYTYSNSTTVLANAIKFIQTQIQVIQNYEIAQLKSGVCLFCLGVKDFKTFIYPPDPNVNLSLGFLINYNYFTNVTNMIATTMWNISQTATVIQNYIVNNLNGYVNTNNSNCLNIQNYVSNMTEIKKRMVCRSFSHCLEFAETYFGTPGASSYMKVFDNFNRFQNMGVTKNRILLQDDLGYKGNITYSPYNKTVPPIIGDIKGNSYDPLS